VPQKPRKTRGFANLAAHLRHTDLKGSGTVRPGLQDPALFAVAASFVPMGITIISAHLSFQTELGQTFVRWSLVRHEVSLSLEKWTNLQNIILIQTKNREVFEKNFASDIAAFNALLSRLREVWARIGTTRGISGHSHVGLLPFSNLLLRHVIFGFEHLSC
jgi:hypothetical protein